MAVNTQLCVGNVGLSVCSAPSPFAIQSAGGLLLRVCTCAVSGHEETVNVSEMGGSCSLRHTVAPVLQHLSRIQVFSFKSISSAELSKSVQACGAVLVFVDLIQTL